MTLWGNLAGGKKQCPCPLVKKSLPPLTSPASKAKNICSYIKNNANAGPSIRLKEIGFWANHGNVKFTRTRPESKCSKPNPTRSQPKKCVQNNRHCWRGGLRGYNISFWPQNNKSAKYPHSSGQIAFYSLFHKAIYKPFVCVVCRFVVWFVQFCFIKQKVHFYVTNYNYTTYIYKYHESRLNSFHVFHKGQLIAPNYIPSAEM